MEDDSPKKKINWILPVVVFVVAAAVAFVIYAWLSGNHVYNSDSDNTDYSNYLSCSAKAVKTPFFDSAGATAVEHQIKVIFSNAKPSKMSYTFKGKYPSEAVARQKSSSFHADYNIHLGERGVNAESLTPTFGVIGDELTINLSAEKGLLNSATAPMFLLSTDEAAKFFNLSSDEVSKIYNQQGLSCILYEQGV